MESPEIIIGLEVHIQLATESKLFCREPVPIGGEHPNECAGPYSLGHPGTLPVLNEAVVDAAILLGLTFDCAIFSTSGFDRKHYFYPDLPKGYQITQQRRPICGSGVFEPADGRDPDSHRIGIRRIHIEEDAGKLIHRQSETLADYNRAGVPLVELVTEPDFRSPEQAADFLRELRRIVRHLGIGDGRMDKGSLRCDANISVRMPDQVDGSDAENGYTVSSRTPSHRVEIKNMNSFRHVERALQFEADRQCDLICRGHRVEQETRKFSADTGETVPMRGKESRPDYRFIPDPDLPLLRVSDERVSRLRNRLAERPDHRRLRYMSEYGLPSDWVRLLTEEKAPADYLDACLSAARTRNSAGSVTRRVAGLIMDELLPALGADTKRWLRAPHPDHLVRVAEMTEEAEISSDGATTLIQLMTGSGETPAEEAAMQLPDDLARAHNLLQTSDTELLRPLVKVIVQEHPDEWRRYVNGKAGLKGFFVGQVLRRYEGAADPVVVSQILEDLRELSAT